MVNLATTLLGAADQEDELLLLMPREAGRVPIGTELELPAGLTKPNNKPLVCDGSEPGGAAGAQLPPQPRPHPQTSPQDAILWGNQHHRGAKEAHAASVAPLRFRQPTNLGPPASVAARGPCNGRLDGPEGGCLSKRRFCGENNITGAQRRPTRHRWHLSDPANESSSASASRSWVPPLEVL